MVKKSDGYRPPAPPALELLPFVHASSEVARWLEHYWHKLHLPREAASHLAVTNSRQEFAVWTGRRLNSLALGCYCYLPNASGGDSDDGDEPPSLLTAESAILTAPATLPHLQPALPGFASATDDDGLTDVVATAQRAAPAASPTADYRHLIFIEPDLLPMSAEVTVAHELIHLSDRVQGHPRKHRCHGYDSISVDEAALTERDPELLRAQLREETARRELALRRVRPYRFVYVCPVCQREYPRVRRYSRPVSCGRCDSQYNLAFILELREVRARDGVVALPRAVERDVTEGDTPDDVAAIG
jgi:hypothetical protein